MRIVCLVVSVTVAVITNDSLAAAPIPDPPASSSDSLSIAECVALARAEAPEVRVAGAELQSARFDSVAAARNRRVTASLFGGVTVEPEGFYDPVLTDLGQYELKAGVAVPLLDGGQARRAQARAAGESALASLELRQAAREAGLRGARLAIAILASREREQAEAAALAWLDDLATLLGSGVRGGAAGPAERLRVDIERDAVRTSLEATRTDLAALERELGQTLGWPAGARPLVRSRGAEEDRAPSPADSLRLLDRVPALPEVRMAGVSRSQSRLDLADAEHQKALRAELSADAGLMGADPTAAVPPELRASNPGANFGDRLRQDLGASATLEFRRPLVLPAAGPTVAARRAGTEAADLRAAVAIDTQRRDALDLLARWRSAAWRVDAARGMVEKAETNLLRVKTLYVAGATGLLDLLDARRMTDDALERLASARAEGRAAQAEAEAEP